MFRIYLTNLGKYNEGYLIGRWIDLPCSGEDLETVLKEIGIDGENYQEYFITDYENDFDIEVEEYDAISKLNELAKKLEELEDYEIKIFRAYMYQGYNVEYALDHLDDACIYYNCDSMTDVAEQYCEECGILDSIPENLRYYFDFETYGRDMSFEGTFVFIDNDCIELF